MPDPRRIEKIRSLRCAGEVQGFKWGLRFQGERLTPDEMRALAEKEREVGA